MRGLVIIIVWREFFGILEVMRVLYEVGILFPLSFALSLFGRNSILCPLRRDIP